MKQSMNAFKSPGRQAGMLTIFAAVLVLFLMTVMLVYASRTTVFDQRVSSNELRYRAAFNLAEAAAAAMLETIEAAGGAVLAGSGWHNGVWTACPSSDAPAICTQDLDTTNFTDFPGFYIHDVGASMPEFAAAIGSITENMPNATARVSVAMQFVNPGGSGTFAPGSEEEEAEAKAVFMVYGYGFSDCTDVDDISTCQGRAAVAQPLGTHKHLAGAPPVPLTSKSMVNGIGSMTVVGNPDAGGVGVMTTVWANNRPYNGNPDAYGGVSEGNGTWQTCQLGDWYDTDEIPAGYTCPGNGANACRCDGVELVSYAKGNASHLELDILEDTQFPDDLFQVFFGVPKTQYRTIKDQATILEDCSSLNASSSGLYWIQGNDCSINNGTVGSPQNPVILVSAARVETRLNGGIIYGVLFVTDVEEREAAGWPAEAPNQRYSDFVANGNNIVYGAVISDTYLEKLNGTFDLVYAEGVLGRATGIGGVGAVDGGWRDFDVPAFEP